MRLGEAELPRQAGVLDAGPARRARAAVVTRDEDVVGARLGDARRDDADADLGDELDRDAGARVLQGGRIEFEKVESASTSSSRSTTAGRRRRTHCALEVVDELLEVLDRVNVVMRRRRDEADARGRVSGAGDTLRDLVAGQLTALAGLGALRHLRGKRRKGESQRCGEGEVEGKSRTGRTLIWSSSASLR